MEIHPRTDPILGLINQFKNPLPWFLDKMQPCLISRFRDSHATVECYKVHYQSNLIKNAGLLRSLYGLEYLYFHYTRSFEEPYVEGLYIALSEEAYSVLFEYFVRGPYRLDTWGTGFVEMTAESDKISFNEDHSVSLKLRLDPLPKREVWPLHAQENYGLLPKIESLTFKLQSRTPSDESYSISYTLKRLPYIDKKDLCREFESQLSELSLRSIVSYSQRTMIIKLLDEEQGKRIQEILRVCYREVESSPAHFRLCCALRKDMISQLYELVESTASSQLINLLRAGISSIRFKSGEDNVCRVVLTNKWHV